jgi:hypothetical protein
MPGKFLDRLYVGSGFGSAGYCRMPHNMGSDIGWLKVTTAARAHCSRNNWLVLFAILMD